MAETISETAPGTGTKWWVPVFKKKNKQRTINILTECNNRLTCMIEDQSRVISSLTFENGRNDRINREYEDKINKLSREADKLEDTVRQLKEFQVSQRDKLQNQYYDIQTLTNEKQDLARGKQAIEQDQVKLQEHIKAKDLEVSTNMERTEKLQEEIDSLYHTNSTLKADLTVTTQTLYEETVKNKLLGKDNQIVQRDLGEERNRREHLEKRIEDIQNSLFVVTAAKSKVENEMGAMNECLKYQLVTLIKKCERKKKKKQQLERDKQLILQYYRPKYTRGQITSTEEIRATDEVAWLGNKNNLAGIGYAEFLQNKVFTLESKVYRRSELIEELSEIIREREPDFSIERSPLLKHYLDTEPTDQHIYYGAPTDQVREIQLTGDQSSVEEMFDILMKSEESLPDSDCNANYSDISVHSTNSDLPNENQSTIGQTSGSVQSLTVYDNFEHLQF